MVALVSAVVSGACILGGPDPSPSGGSTASTTTTTTSTIVPSTTTPGGLIDAGPSRSQCLAPYLTAGHVDLHYLQAAVNAFQSETGTTVSCLSTYLNGAQTWAQWVHPWITDSTFGYSTWVAEEPQSRELVVQVNLIPNALKDVSDPLNWERACADGDYDSYASGLGNSLVEVGLQNTVIRLGPEMNGKWEADFVGTTTQEQRLWATCFANEVTALRGVTGAHFLFDWNPNACKGRFPYMNYYPGSAYVDIVGLDLFDVGCITPTQSLTFQQLASEPYGLGSFEAFAAKQDKPMSLPEWALSSVPAGDDPQFISGMGKTVESQDFAFETYFDGGGDGAKALALGPRTPRSLVAFRQWFGKRA